MAKEQKEQKEKKEKKEKKEEKKDKDKKEKKEEKKEKKEKKEDKEAKGPADVPAGLPKEEAKKDKKDKKDKKEKKDKAAAEVSPAKKPRTDGDDDANFWADLGSSPAPAASTAIVPVAETPAPGTPEGAGDETARLEAEAEAEATKFAAQAAAERRKASEEAAAAAAAAEVKAQAEKQRLAQEEEAARLAFEEEERQRLAEEEAAKDPNAPRSIPLSRLDLQWLHAEGSRHLKRVQVLAVGATIEVPDADEDMGHGGSDKVFARVAGASPEAINRGALCLRAALASFNGEAVELPVQPEEDAAYLAVVDLPENAGVAVQPQKLADTFGVIAAIVQLKVVDPDAILPKSRWAPPFARGLGLSLGLAVEGRFDEDWFHGEITGFNGENGVVIRWLGGDGEAELPAVDVRRAQNKPPPLPKNEHVPGGRLVVFGALRSRTAALLHAMTLVERKLPGHFSERNPLKATSDLFGFGLKLVKVPAADTGHAVERRRPQIAGASEAIVEVLGNVAVVAGEPEERARAEILITQMVPQAGPYSDAKRIPDTIADSSSLVRVPTDAFPHLMGSGRSDMVSIEDETNTIMFWLPVGTEAPPRAGPGSICIGGVLVDPTTKVHAKYEGEYCPATIVSAGSVAGRVLISWEFDGSEQEVPLKTVKMISKAARQRAMWLENPRVLAIIGPEKNRRACALRILAASENACQGLWSGGMTEVLAEVRDGLKDEDVIFGVEAVPLTGTAAQLEWATSPLGLASSRGAAHAARCIIEYVGRLSIFVGFPHERELAREYNTWAVLSRKSGGMRMGTLSVPDADMREDITVMSVPEGKVGRLKPERVASIEKDTETISLFDDGGGTLQAEGSRRLLICGGDANLRDLARYRIQALLDSENLGVFDVVARSQGPVVRPDAPAPAAAAPYAAPAAAAPAPAPRKTNPKQVLATMAFPSSINEWGTLQKKVFEGHPKLPMGWIRVWSRSQDSEYYLRLKDMKSTFEFDEVTD